MTCLVFNACSDPDDVAGGNLVDVLKNNKWQFEYVDDYNESQYGDYFYTYAYRLYFMDNNVGYHYTVEKEYESGSGYSQKTYFDKFTYNVSGNTVEVRFKNGTDTYIYNGGFLALGDDIYTPSAMTQSDRDFVNRKAQEIDDEEETNEIVNNLDDYVSVSSKFIEEDLCIEFTLNTMLSEDYPDKSFEYGIEYGYGNYSNTSNLDMAGKSSKNFTMSVLFDECALYMKSYTELVDKINSGEKLTESEQDFLEDIIYEVERKVKSFKARIFVEFGGQRYYVYDEPEISDYEYDMMYAELKRLEEENPSLYDANSPTQRVGGKALDKFEKVTHSVRMDSLSDVFSFEETEDFCNKMEGELLSPAYSVEPKIDGLSVSLIYENGEFVKKETYDQCLLTYIECADEATGTYPLTEDLKYIIQQRGEYAGWWDLNGSYLFVDENGVPVNGINAEIAWLFMCCYLN